MAAVPFPSAHTRYAFSHVSGLGHAFQPRLEANDDEDSVSILSELGHLAVPINFLLNGKQVGSNKIRTRDLCDQSQTLCRYITLVRHIRQPLKV